MIPPDGHEPIRVVKGHLHYGQKTGGISFLFGEAPSRRLRIGAIYPAPGKAPFFGMGAAGKSGVWYTLQARDKSG
jgi:hypothetical protein